MSNLPYVTASGNIKKALEGIARAATPPKLSQDFVKTVLKIPGGSGDQMTSFLKKIGLASSDGTPTPLYNQFRNPSTSGQAIAQAIRTAYEPLFRRNEYMYDLSDKELQGLIVEETGQAHDSNAVSLIFSCIKQLKSLADFGSTPILIEERRFDPTQDSSAQKDTPLTGGGIGLNLGYTINLNLPATTDIAVFNAIFKSPRENLLRETDG
ncbi:DUF5343 domain-containing protein [Brucella intermedia GD04153]|uniref:DUF5343 domain-containing protein n=1 Tax=Brucella intermedia GD04153 TaxID=2975438 RepID=A0AA42GXM8_9HYPH|nr:DUF5343 domain-containing protein [Brucella intermedia]MDH0124304.1 DUF5343 domain-containing protein [Brucella intermedia GD04153]